MINTRYTAEESLNEIRLRMSYNPAKTLNENKLSLIENFVDTSASSECVVITDWVSPDNKYVILLDELYDLHSKKNLGDIWENFDNFKLFISHSFNVANNVPQQIKENINNTIKSLLLTESTNGDMSKLKPIFKELLSEYSWDKFKGDVKGAAKGIGKFWSDAGKKFGNDIVDMGKKGWEGIKQAGIAISQLDFKKILELLGKGVLYLARKIRSLLYNPVGIVLDSILIATGIGKGVQWVPWAFVVGLDIYEVASGDYEDKDMPTWLRWLMIGCDVLGLVFAGGVAAAARAAFKVFRGAKTMTQFAAIAKTAPNTVKFIQKIAGALSSVPRLLSKTVSYLKTTRFVKGSKWLSGILGKANKFLNNMAKSLKNLSAAAGKGSVRASKTVVPTLTASQKLVKGAKAGVTTAGVITVLDKGIKKGVQIYQGKTDAEVAKDAADLESFENISKTYKEETGMSLEDKLNLSFK